MGTMMTDMGLAHAAFTPQQEPSIAKRWKSWEPLCLIEARRTEDPAGALAEFRVRHRARLVSLLSARIAWTTIRRLALDDPCVSYERFEFLLRCAVDRRRYNMGRVRGVRREPGSVKGSLRGKIKKGH